MSESGRKLKEIRESKGYSLDDVHLATRLNKEYLKKLENDEYECLPEVYIKSFIKTYCHFLDVEEKPFIDYYDEIIHKEKKSHIVEKIDSIAKDRENQEKSHLVTSADYKLSKPFRINLWVVIGILIIVFAVIFFYKDIENIFSKKEAVQPKTEEQTQRFIEKKQNEVTTENNIAEKRYTLEIKADDKVWIQVIADKNLIEAKNFLKDEVKTYQASTEFELIIGSVGNVKLTLNGKTVPITGGIGMVRRLKLDSTGVKFLVAPQRKSENKL